MQAGGFGRKGMADGDGVPRPAQRIAQPASPVVMARRTTLPRGTGGPNISSLIEDPVLRKREAFLAEERARRVDESAYSGRRNDSEFGGGGYRPADIDFETPYSASSSKKKSMALAYVLWWFGYAFSAHRFYLGDTSGAIKQCGGFLGGLLVLGIGVAANIGPLKFLGGASMLFALAWMLFDMFLIPGICRRANAALIPQHNYFE